MNMIAALPEMIILAIICITLLLTLYVPENYKSSLAYGMTQIGVVLALIAVYLLNKTIPLMAFNGMFFLDRIACLLKIFILLTCFVTFLFSRAYLQQQKIAVAEYYILGLFSLLGMLILVSAYNLITLYLGLELLSLPLYAMTAIKRESVVASEAAMKFFVLGAFASGFLLYGMSMLYGATGNLDIATIADAIVNKGATDIHLLAFAMVFIVVGIAFKFGAVPFHLWVPDVYEGAPSSVTLLVSSAPKIAALGLALRLLMTALPDLVVQWQQCLIIVAVLSMALGNIVAIVQQNIKRMLAYSSIAHMGYLFLGILAANKAGYGAALFYIVNYGIMAVGAFGILVILSRNGFEVENISDLRGLHQRNPWLAFVMLIFMFSMAGIPPTVGFFAKLAVLKAVIDLHMAWLAALGLIFAVMGAYYYINVVKTMYFEEALDTSTLSLSLDVNVVMSVAGLAVLLLGIFPSALLNYCYAAF